MHDIRFNRFLTYFYSWKLGIHSMRGCTNCTWYAMAFSVSIQSEHTSSYGKTKATAIVIDSEWNYDMHKSIETLMAHRYIFSLLGDYIFNFINISFYFWMKCRNHNNIWTQHNAYRRQSGRVSSLSLKLRLRQTNKLNGKLGKFSPQTEAKWCLTKF